MKPPVPATSPVSVRGTALDGADARNDYRLKIARITLDSMVQFVGLLDADGTVLEINQVALDAVGITLDEVEGKPFWTTFWWQVSPEINAELREMIRRAAAGEFVRWDTEIFGRAGGRETIIIDASLMPVRDDDGRVVFLTVEGRDLSPLRSEAQSALRRGEEHLRAVVDTTPACIKIVAADGTLLDMNASGLAMVEADSAEQVRGASVYNLIVPEHRAAFIAFNERICRGERGSLEFDIQGMRGTRRHMESYAAPLRGPDGTVRQLAITHDITDRKRADAAFRRHNELLKLLWEAAAVLLRTDQPDDMLRGLFAKIAGPLGLDSYFNFMVTDGGEALRLVSCAGIPESTARTLECLDFGQAVCGNVALRKAPIVATGIQESDEPMVQLVKGFGIRSYACNPLLAGDRLLGTLSFASRTRDRFEPEEVEFLETITQYVAVAYERVRLIDELRAQDRRKDEFLATLAHELRNPLAPIRNGLQLIRLAGGNPATLAEARAMMERQVIQMVRLVDDLLDVSRISRSRLELRREWVDLASIVTAAVETSRPIIESSQHELDVRLPDGPILLDADPIRLSQSVSNLLNNAAKYTEPGGRIALHASRVGNEAIIRVRDNGIGIPAELLPRIFDMFVQVEKSLERSQGGLGIGLTLVERLIRMHGGSVEAASDGPGRGSEFTIRLPILVMPEGRDEPAADGHGAAPVTVRRILVADDNRDSADSLAMILKLLGHHVITTYDGADAVAAAAAECPDVALLDLGMPRMDGYEVARILRTHPDCPGIHLVALTGWGQDEDRRRTIEAGFHAHLVKPADATTLQELLAKLPVR
jgi:PAS domain S-box-containing protein